MASETLEPLAPPRAAPDPDKLNDFMGKMVGDMGAAISGALVVLGDRLGLYKALAERGPSTSAELAEAAGIKERYAREWLAAQAASEYVTYDAKSGRFFMSPEQATVFADEESPAFMAGGYEIIAAMFKDEPKLSKAFKAGAGFGWHEHDVCLFRGTERFFRPGYNANLVSNWIPALDGVAEKLAMGARVADVGCGHGASTILMAKAYPKSRFIGFDYHGPSIERAQALAAEAGVAGRTDFQTAAADSYPGEGYDLVCIFDALHDMGDPVGAARHIRKTLKPDGTWLLVEPFAHDDMADNLNPVGRLFYSASTMLCTPASLSQDVGLGLGAQAGEARLRAVTAEAGFTRFRRATETPFNLIFEVRP
ncbi:class I SAM-dependent methyltransferase [Phenylobacterium sp.]|uniref:class I SAM-dependent methyltransferase n=1 Tax=Phenylobacterium sp. TaxID=1871053 RepID=UPI002E32A545|nr:methyltransferase domain-containing protein [Phenylobacterium sp.]HEX3363798.1 methyltransferase domain-containing protein [Phenylobacterium sp.]